MPPPIQTSKFIADGLGPVRDMFAENFAVHDEIGAGFCAYCGDELLVDLLGGTTGPDGQTPMTESVLLPVYSTTKGVAALVLAKALQEHADAGYDTRIASIWPRFGAEGKHNITIGDFVSHQAGLVGFAHEVSRDIWADPQKCADGLADCKPVWPLGAGSGYHPASWGYVVGEIVRRLTGESLGAILRGQFTTCPAVGEEIDFHIGLSQSDQARCGKMRRPAVPPDLGEINEERRLAFIVPWNRHTMSEQHWRSIEIPSTNGHGTARSVARLYGIYANHGRLNGHAVLSEASMAELTRVRVSGTDRVLTFPVAFAAGVMVNEFGLFGPERTALVHPGWGGSIGLADPKRRIAIGYVPNRQSALLGCDPRAKRLIEALYSCL